VYARRWAPGETGKRQENFNEISGALEQQKHPERIRKSELEKL